MANDPLPSKLRFATSGKRHFIFFMPAFSNNTITDRMLWEELILADTSFVMECIIPNPPYISEASMSDVQKIEGYFLDSPAINSSVSDLSDEEISTKKEKHLRLGPEDLNDTIPFEY